MILTTEDLLRETSLEHVQIDTQTTVAHLEAKLESGRIHLLSALKAAGVEKLSDRRLYMRPESTTPKHAAFLSSSAPLLM